MKECTNDYFEEDIPEDDLTDALEQENAAIRHVFWKQILKGDFLDAI